MSLSIVKGLLSSKDIKEQDFKTTLTRNHSSFLGLVAQAYIPELRTQRQNDYKFKVTSSYTQSLRPAWATKDPSQNST